MYKNLNIEYNFMNVITFVHFLVPLRHENKLILFVVCLLFPIFGSGCILTKLSPKFRYETRAHPQVCV